MTTIKSFSDLNQSRKLSEILPLSSADMYYSHEFVNSAGDYYKLNVPSNEYFEDGEDPGSDIPCWSLAALLGALPILERKGYQKAKPQLLYNVAINKWIVDSHIYTTDAYDNPFDACYEMILKLHELKKL